VCLRCALVVAKLGYRRLCPRSVKVVAKLVDGGSKVCDSCG
jgi:hypothetical protein